MTNARLIEHARLHLVTNNKQAYLKAMQGLIRSSMSTRTTNQIKKAMLEDGYKID